MKRSVPLILLSLGACGAQRESRVEIATPPDVLATANTSLLVPKSCPIYAPGGGDVDTPEPPFPENVSIVCGVDQAGGTYGLVNGDAPTARLAVLPGSQELGLYIGVKPSAQFTPDKAIVSGDNANLKAWSAPTNVDSRTSCCAEFVPGSQRPIDLVAAVPQGMMISLGTFDASSTQVNFEMDVATLFAGNQAYSFGWNVRFYVNGPP